MAVIVFYESTPIDIFQLNEGLSTTDHYWEFKEDVISPDNINPEAEVISVFTGSNVTRQLIEKMPKLKLIATRSSDYEHIDLAAASKRGIVVVNVPTYGENTVAEYTFGLLLAVTRRLPKTISDTAEGKFVARKHTGIDLSGRTLGIIGIGNIGQHTARIAKGFGMKVIAHDIYHNSGLANDIGFTYESFDDVLATSDVLSLHVPLTSTNYHMINKATIAKMKPGAILVNTARGELVETRALIAALKNYQLSGAALDSVEGGEFLQSSSLIDAISTNATAPTSYEQAAEVHALLQQDNVVITHHAAFNTTEAIKRINDITVQNVTKFWYGDTSNRVHRRNDTGKLVIVRHGQSEWNAKSLWTGLTDVHLNQKGTDDSYEFGKKLHEIKFDYAYTSKLIRTQETLTALIKGLGQKHLQSEASSALNERDYGVYTSMNKESIEESIGQKAFNELRRSWDSPIEGGESLKDVYQRVVPFYLRIILPRLRHGQNVLIVAHGNSIRSLIKYIENIADSDIGDLEMLQDAALVYEVDFEGRAKAKEAVSLEAPNTQDKTR